MHDLINYELGHATVRKFAKYINGSVHAFRRIWVEEGMKGFYLGIGPNLIRSVGGAVLLVTYDIFKSMIF